jgi:hypothetical protein
MGCVSPKLDQSVEALCRLNGGDNPVIEQLAVDILWHMYMLKARQVETKRLGKSVGPAKELRDLERAARRAIQGKLSKAGWAAAWARTHARIRNQIWRPKAPPIASRKLNATGRLIEFERAPLRGGGGSVHVPGFDLLVPSPKDTLDAITTEQEQIKQTAGYRTSHTQARPGRARRHPSNPFGLSEADWEKGRAYHRRQRTAYRTAGPTRARGRQNIFHQFVCRHR